MESKKLYEIQICTGTLCHVMGGAELPGLASYLPPALKKKVKLKGMVCGNYCKEPNRKPPFVLVNNQLIEAASVEKIIMHLQKCEENDSHQ
ncbi:MAG: hypothetical protein R6U66_00470 [Bacteroidales bacterium]